MDKQMTLVELFPDTFKEQHTEKAAPAAPEKKNLNSRLYWQYSLDIVNTWAGYQKNRKLHSNATNPDTFPVVKDVVYNKKYYGSVHNVYDRKEQLYTHLCTLLEEYKEICGLYQVESIDLKWLRRNLKVAKDYASYRGKCERRRNSEAPPISLRGL